MSTACFQLAGEPFTRIARDLVVRWAARHGRRTAVPDWEAFV